MKVVNRKSISAKLSKFCYLAKDDHFIGVTDWVNGEGFDISIERGDSQRIALTYGEIKAISVLCGVLESKLNEEDK